MISCQVDQEVVKKMQQDGQRELGKQQKLLMNEQKRKEQLQLKGWSVLLLYAI